MVELLVWTVLGAALAFGGFWAIRRFLAWFARPRIRATPAAPPEFDLAPALVCLLSRGGDDAPQATASTVLDLAARGHLVLAGSGTDPDAVTIALPSPRRPVGGSRRGLRPHEDLVLRRVTDAIVAAAPTPSTLASLQRWRRDELERWVASVQEAVIREAGERGLVVRSGGHLASVLALSNLIFLALSFVVSRALVDLAVPDSAMGSWPALAGVLCLTGLMVFALTLALLGLMGRRTERHRLTRRGRRVAAYWLGVRRWLRAHESFADLPPVAVEVWGRNVGYGAALGVCTRATVAIGHVGSRAPAIGSAYGGRFRPVTVRYPGMVGTAPVSSGVRLAASLGGLALLGAAWYRWHGDAIVLSGLTRLVAGWAAVPVGGWLAYLAGRAAADLLVPVRITGLVVARTEIRRGGACTIVLDDGRGAVTTAWSASRRLAEVCRPDQVVQVRGQRWSRRLGSVRPANPALSGAGLS